MRELFESTVTAEHAHVGRWRTELEGAEREAALVEYEQTLDRLRADGITCAPPHREVAVSYRGERETANPLDYWADGLALDA
jgi:hypothetical protein